MAVLRVMRDGVFRPVGQRWGPTGRQAPYTPAYNTTATATATSIATLQTAINAAASGSVIEYTPALGELGTSYTLTGGSPVDGSGDATWAQNTLIRPPLGTRKQLGSGTITIQAKGVTLAGYDYDGVINIENTALTSEGARSGLWRMVGTAEATRGKIQAVRRGFWCEVVQARRYWGPPDEYDRMRVLANNNVDGYGNLVEGCWLAGAIPRCGGTGTGGVAPSGSNTAWTATQLAPVLTQVLSSGTLSGFSGPMTVNDIAVMTPRVAIGASITLEFKKNGTSVFTMVAPGTTILGSGTTYNTPATRDYARQYASGTITTLDNGDTITATVTALSGSVPEIRIFVGVKTDNHSDTFQTYRAGTGTGQVKGLILRHSVLDGSDNGAIQAEAHAEDFLMYRNWIGLDRGYNLRVNATTGGRLHMTGNYMAGRGPSFGLGGDIYSMHKNVLGGALSFSSGTYTADATNTVVSGLSVLKPAIPNLATIWPDCPYVGDPSAA